METLIQGFWRDKKRRPTTRIVGTGRPFREPCAHESQGSPAKQQRDFR